EKSVQVRVVDPPGDGVSAESEHAQRVPGHLPVPEVAGDDQERPVADQPADNAAAVDQLDVPPPVGRVQPAGGLAELDERGADVAVDGRDVRVDGRVGRGREGAAKIVPGDLTVPAVDAVRDPGEDPGERLGLGQGQRLDDAHDQADGEVDGVVGGGV